ncbi:MAG: SiaB family protein kinase [Sulfurimonadaceae bacterium]|nr:SiaB family protein kinase [Sulfurimonadaceae bacterium]
MKFDQLEGILEEDGIVFLSYGGFLTQPLIAGMTDALEKEAENNDLSMKVAGNIYTVFIELSQNMMNYSKDKLNEDSSYESKGLVVVGMEPDGNSYYIISRNLVDNADKIIIDAKLKELENLDREQLRKLYRERRKAGKEKHERGAGIGFVEIARRCDKVQHSFEPYNDNRHFFTVKTTINKTL